MSPSGVCIYRNTTRGYKQPTPSGVCIYKNNNKGDGNRFALTYIDENGSIYFVLKGDPTMISNLYGP